MAHAILMPTAMEASLICSLFRIRPKTAALEQAMDVPIPTMALAPCASV